MELAERLGPSLDWWLGRSYAFALWTYRQLQEIDRRRTFEARLDRYELAHMIARGFHQVDTMHMARDAILESAASPIAQHMARAHRMLSDLRTSNAMVD